MKQWDLNLWTDSTSPIATAGWNFELQSGRVKHDVSLDFGVTEITTSLEVQREFVYRVLCHVMIDNLPTAALQEAAEDIADLLQIHYTTPAQLPKGSVSVQLPKLQGRIGKAQKPKPFHLEP